MRSLTRSRENKPIDREELVNRLKTEAKLQNLGRLMIILINLLSKKKILKKLAKREGQEVQMNFPAYKIENNCLTFTLSEYMSDPVLKPSENPILTITYNMEENELFSILNTMVTKKSTLGLLGFLLKNLRKGKIKSEGSLRVSILFSKLFLIGDHEIFQKEKKKK